MITTGVQGDFVIATLPDGRKVPVHRDQWEHAYARLDAATLLAALTALADQNDGLGL
jgi:hypothetical protein